ncbi:MAG: TRASH domain protein [candidate division NC10 bacterium]|jgi:YHS domain-containing protein
MRLLLILFWLAVAAAVLLPLLRRVRLSAARPRRSLPDELVKDPVCQTYVVKSRAVSRTHRDEVRYFCSAECARRAADR